MQGSRLELTLQLGLTGLAWGWDEREGRQKRQAEAAGGIVLPVLAQSPQRDPTSALGL